MHLTNLTKIINHNALTLAYALLNITRCPNFNLEQSAENSSIVNAVKMSMLRSASSTT